MVRRILIPVTLCLMIASCNTPVHVEQDSSVKMEDYHTYMWVDTRNTQNNESTRDAQFAEISVRNYVNSELKEMGWKEVAENPDALVSYDFLVEREVVQQSDPVYTQPFTRYYYNPYTRRWNSIYYPSQFMGYDNYEMPVREGTLTISLIDAKTDRRIWQGWTTEEMNNSRLTAVEIGKSIRNIFKKFNDAVASR